MVSAHMQGGILHISWDLSCPADELQEAIAVLQKRGQLPSGNLLKVKTDSSQALPAVIQMLGSLYDAVLIPVPETDDQSWSVAYSHGELYPLNEVLSDKSPQPQPEPEAEDTV